MTEKEDKDLLKLSMLYDALKQVQEQDEDDDPGFFDELKQGAWNVLHENPGCDCGDWIAILMEQYPTELVDAIGSHPAETYAQLEDWWECEEYEDDILQRSLTFSEWAEYFATERSVELYDILAEEKCEKSHFSACNPNNDTNPHSNS